MKKTLFILVCHAYFVSSSAVEEHSVSKFTLHELGNKKCEGFIANMQYAREFIFKFKDEIIRDNAANSYKETLMNLTTIEIKINKLDAKDVPECTIDLVDFDKLRFNHFYNELSIFQRHPRKFIIGSICIGFTLGFGLGYYKDQISTTLTGIFAIPGLFTKLR